VISSIISTFINLCFWRDRILIAFMRLPEHRFKFPVIKLIKKIFFIEDVSLITKSGIKLYLYPEDSVQYAIIRDGCYEPKSLSLVKHLLKKDGGIFIDIGGHIGQYTLEVAKLMGECKVIVIEPNPKTFAYLMRNIQINQLKNIIPILGAVSDATNFASMVLPPDRNWGASRETLSLSEEFAYKVPTFTISNLLDSLGIKSIDMIKIDVEGKELQVLKGLLGNQQHIPKYIVFEYLPHIFSDSYLVIDYLKESGYDLYNVVGDLWDSSQEIPENNLLAIYSQTPTH